MKRFAPRGGRPGCARRDHKKVSRLAGGEFSVSGVERTGQMLEPSTRNKTGLVTGPGVIKIVWSYSGWKQPIRMQDTWSGHAPAQGGARAQAPSPVLEPV